MHILLLGGTGFIGGHIAEALLAAGHSVSTLARGQTADELPPQIERLRGDRDASLAGLQALRGRTWDACIDISGYIPRQVRPAAELLGPTIQRYVFISAVSVYGDPTDRPVTESHPLVASAPDDVTDLTGPMYGAAKVACENLLTDLYGDRCTLLRPQIVAGPRDPSGRYTYWVQRAARPGPMLAPGNGTDHLQVIDVRDLARFVETVLEHDRAGAYNLAGPRFTWAEFIRMLGAKEVVWVPAANIEAAGVTESELPLFRPERGPRSALMDVINVHARAAGLSLTDPEVTLRNTRDWLRGKAVTPTLSAAREQALIRSAD